MKTKDPIIDHLKTLRNAAPSISLLDLSKKSCQPSEAAHLANLLGEATAKKTFKQGKCTYTVYNTWEHFDYLIRQHARIRRKDYAHNRHSTYPRFRTRRAGEGGFSSPKKNASTIRVGTLLYGSDQKETLFICTYQSKENGITLQPLNGDSSTTSFTSEIVAKAKVYIPRSPQWLVLDGDDTAQNLILIRRYNPELYQIIRQLKSQQICIQTKEKLRQRRFQKAAEELEAKRLQREAQEKQEPIAA